MTATCTCYDRPDIRPDALRAPFYGNRNKLAAAGYPVGQAPYQTCLTCDEGLLYHPERLAVDRRRYVAALWAQAVQARERGAR